MDAGQLSLNYFYDNNSSTVNPNGAIKRGNDRISIKTVDNASLEAMLALSLCKAKVKKKGGSFLEEYGNSFLTVESQIYWA